MKKKWFKNYTSSVKYLVLKKENFIEGNFLFLNLTLETIFVQINILTGSYHN